MQGISRSTLVGIGAGGTAGLVVAVLSALGIVDIPSIGSLAAGGVWAAAPVGLITGAGAGALVGSLANEDDEVDEEEAAESED